MTTQHICKVVFDGNDGTGKTMVTEAVRKEFPQILFQDRGELTKLSDKYPDKTNVLTRWTDGLPIFHIILDAEPDTCLARIQHRGGETDKFDSHKSLFCYRNRFRRLAIQYRVPIIDTTHMHPDEVIDTASDIIKIFLTIVPECMDKGVIPNYTEFVPIEYRIVNPDDVTPTEYAALPLLTEGFSKQIRIWDDKFTLIEYKATVYSHKQQREGWIKDTDKERMAMTSDILCILDMEGIPHAYIYIGERYVLCEKLSLETDIPPVEVIVKKCCLGTDKYRYHGIDALPSRFADPETGGLIPVVSTKNREYPDIIVRFDFRNPNHAHYRKIYKPTNNISKCEQTIIWPWMNQLNKVWIALYIAYIALLVVSVVSGQWLTVVLAIASGVASYYMFADGKRSDKKVIENVRDAREYTLEPLNLPKYISDEKKAELRADPDIVEKAIGDEAMCDDTANFFINVAAAKALAKSTFKALDKHFEAMGVYFEDVCFMLTTDGTKHYYEISQDCGRYKKLTEDGMTDMDKDVWRAGGSSELVADKWHQMSELVHAYVTEIYGNFSDTL